MDIVMDNNQKQHQTESSNIKQNDISRRNTLRALSAGAVGLSGIGLINGTSGTVAANSEGWEETKTSFEEFEPEELDNRYRETKAVLEYSGQDKSYGEILHRFSLSMISHTFYGSENIQREIVPESQHTVQEGSEIEINGDVDGFSKHTDLVFDGYVGAGTDVSWEEVVNEDSDSLDEIEDKVDTKIEEETDEENGILRDLAEWGVTTAMDEITSRAGSAVSLASIIASYEPGNECNGGVDGNGWEWCFPDGATFNYHTATFDFRYEPDGSDNSVTITQDVLQNYEPYEEDKSYNPLPMEWELNLPAYEADASIADD